jgi:hypothetical protein
MKNVLLCLLSVVLLFSAMPAAQAGFVIEKEALTAISAKANSSTTTATAASVKSSVSHPIYQRARYAGWQGIFALICGIAGFFWGGFALLAILFGIMGIGRRHRNSALAIAGLVLGLTMLCLAIFAGFWGFPLY